MPQMSTSKANSAVSLRAGARSHYNIIGVFNNTLDAEDVDPESIGREIGVLQKGETVAER